MKITTAMPLVKPITTDSGMKRIMRPDAAAPANSSTPDIIGGDEQVLHAGSATMA